MANIVTKRFVECHDLLKEEQKIKSSRQFAISIGTLPQSLNEILKGNRDATVKNLMGIVEEFGVSERYLLSGEGPMFFQEEEPVIVKQDKIVYMSAPAYAGSIDQFHELLTEEDVVKFSIPGYQDNFGDHRCFDVRGDSMEPTLTQGDMIICSRIPANNRYSCIKDMHVYVVITQTDIMVKRVVNQIDSNASIKLISDNDFYEDRVLPAEQIRELWRVNLKLSQFMSDPNQGGVSRQIKLMERTLQSQAACIDRLQETIQSHFVKN